MTGQYGLTIEDIQEILKILKRNKIDWREWDGDRQIHCHNSITIKISDYDDECDGKEENCIPKKMYIEVD